MSEHSKQPSSSGVGGSSIIPDVKSSVLTNITNSASSRSPKASGKLPAVQHDQPLVLIPAQVQVQWRLSHTIPAHLANVGNIADDPMKVHDSGNKSPSSDDDHQVSNDGSSSDSSSDSERGSGPKSGSNSTTSGSGSYTDSSVSTIITDGSHFLDDSGSPKGSPISRCTRHKSSCYIVGLGLNCKFIYLLSKGSFIKFIEISFHLDFIVSKIICKQTDTLNQELIHQRQF